MDSGQKAKPTGEQGRRKRGRDPDDNGGGGSSKRYDADVLATRFAMETPKTRSKTVEPGRDCGRANPSSSGQTRKSSGIGVLPQRLFPEDDIPSGGRINAYSKPDYLCNLTEILDGSEEFECIKDSPFGALFEIQPRKAILSGKLVHQFLCRSLMTRKKHEHWFVFGGRPIRFSLKEFGYLTGLNCDPYPEDDPLAPGNEHKLGEDSFWRKLIGARDYCLVADIIEMLRVDKDKPEEHRMTRGRRLRLALVVLVEGLLIPTTWGGTASPTVVEMTRDIDAFLEYPWGRKSFELTLEMVTIGNQHHKTAKILQKKLSSSHLTLKGFMLSFQLLIYNTVPMLTQELRSDPKLLGNFLDPSLKELPKLKRFHNDTIRRIETDRKLHVISILSSGFKLQSSDFSWPDETEDRTVDELVLMISKGHDFKTVEWVVGDENFPNKPVKDKKKRQAGMGVPTMKQATLRKMLKGKGKITEEEEAQGNVNVESEKRKDIEEDDVDSEVELADRLVAARRAEIITAVDMALASVKSAWMAERKRRVGMSYANRQTFNVPNVHGAEGTSSQPVPMSVDNFFTSKSADTNDPMPATKLDFSDEGVENLVEKCNTAPGKVPRDEIDESVNVILAQLNRLPVDMGGREGLSEVGETDKEGQGFEATEDPLTGVSTDAVGSEEFGEETVVDDQKSKGDFVENRETVDVAGRNTETVVVAEPTSEVAKAGCEEQNDEEEGEEDVNEEDEGYEKGDISTAKSTNVQRDDFVDLEADGTGSESGQGENSTHCEVRDSKEKEEDFKMPLRSKRERRPTKRFGQDNELKIVDVQKEIPVAPDEPESEHEKMKKQFVAKLAAYRHKEYVINKQNQPKSFFRELYKAANDIGEEHMEVMLHCLWRRLRNFLAEKRIVILDSWFTKLLKQESAQYGKSKRAVGSHNWNSSLRMYVAGEVSNRLGRVAWLVDVDVIYAPMDFGDNHWVALSIDLRSGNISIYDPNVALFSDAKVGKRIKPFTETLPALVHDLAPQDFAVYAPATKFDYCRPKVPQNVRGGDSGPMTVMYIEQLSQGLPVDVIDDEVVEHARLLYAIEVYKQFVEMLG